MRKDRLREILDQFPEDVDLGEFCDRLRLIDAIDIAERQIAKGDVFSREEVKTILKEYL